jgi:hypothetical protein
LQNTRPLVLARVRGLDPAKTALSNFKIESTLSASPAGDVVDLFFSQSEQSVVNFILRLADSSGFAQEQNATFRLTSTDGTVSLPFGFLYVIRADPSVRVINSVSTTLGSILGGTPVVIMLRYLMNSRAYKSQPARGTYKLFY